MKRISYLSLAEIEMTNAAEIYDSKRESLGRRFLGAIKATEKRIQDNPELYAFRRPPVRSCRVQGFPYRLYFVEEADRVLVLAVAHASRNPQYWHGRL